MNRRQYLATVGVASASTVLAGCLSGDEYRTYDTGGQEVPLAPVEDTYEWYQEDALFLDATNEVQHQRRRIDGSELSPPARPDFEHPTEGVDPDRRIVTYCICPYNLAGARAAELLNEGFERVYAIEEGLDGWDEAGYPIAGAVASPAFSLYTVSGRTDPAAAGQQVWLEEPESNQRYVTRVDEDGTFEMTFEFADVDDETIVVLELPDQRLERTLGELSDGEVRL